MAFNKMRYDNDYRREHYDTLTVLVPKGKRKELKEAATLKGLTVSQYVVEALEAQYGHELSMKEVLISGV